jgi:hypothetical protein
MAVYRKPINAIGVPQRFTIIQGFGFRSELELPPVDAVSVPQHFAFIQADGFGSELELVVI